MPVRRLERLHFAVGLWPIRASVTVLDATECIANTRGLHEARALILTRVWAARRVRTRLGPPDGGQFSAVR